MARPDGQESAARVRRLLSLLASGLSLRDAAREARVDPDRVLGLLEDPSFRRAANALLDDRIAA